MTMDTGCPEADLRISYSHIHWQYTKSLFYDLKIISLFHSYFLASGGANDVHDL